MNELISVIIPVYKVEDYLSRCVNSMIGQTYSNLEIILVDDGSPDRCGEICDLYAENDKRIKVIHKKNGGLSDARNAGIEIASGDYLTFIDSDDWVHETYIERLYRLVKDYNSSISVCNFIYTSKEEIQLELTENKVYVYSNIEAIEQIYGWIGAPMAVAWGKLYKRDLFYQIRFPVGKIHEDVFTTYKLLYKASKIIYTSEPLLYYWQRQDSIMGSGFNVKHRLNIIEAYTERAEFFDGAGLDDLKNETYKRLFYFHKELIENKDAVKELSYDQKFINEFQKLRSILRKGKYNFKFKVIYEMYYLFPTIIRMAYRIRSILKKQIKIISKKSHFLFKKRRGMV